MRWWAESSLLRPLVLQTAAPDRDALVRCRGQGDDKLARALVPPARGHALEQLARGALVEEGDPPISHVLPTPGDLALDSPVGVEPSELRGLQLGRDVLAVIDQGVVTGDVAAPDRLRTGGRALAPERRVTVGRDHRPPGVVDEHLVHADLVELAAPRETRVEDEEVTVGLLVVVGGVVPRRDVAGPDPGVAEPALEQVRAHQLLGEGLDRGVVEQRQRQVGLHARHVVAERVEVGPVGLHRARHADVVPAIGGEPTERREHVVVLRVRAVEDVGALDAAVVATHQVLPVALAGHREPGGRVQLEDEDAARVGPVHQPQLPVPVEEGVRVHDVGVEARVVDVHAVLADLVPHARAQEDALRLVGALDVVGDRDAHGRARRVVPAQVVVHVEAPVLELDHVVRPEPDLARPLEDLGELGRDALEQGVGLVHAVGDQIPPGQVGGLRGGEVGAEDVEGVADPDHRRIVDRDVLELGSGVARALAPAALLGGRAPGDAQDGSDHDAEACPRSLSHGSLLYRWGSAGREPGGWRTIPPRAGSVHKRRRRERYRRTAQSGTRRWSSVRVRGVPAC